MSSRRDGDLPESSARHFSRGTQLQLLAVVGAIAAVFAIAHEATRPFWPEWGISEPSAPPLTAAQIEALQAPQSENELSDDWTLSSERLRRLIPAAEELRGVDAEIDRRWRNVIEDLTSDQKFELLNVLLVATGERPTEQPVANEAADAPASSNEPADAPFAAAAESVALSPETFSAVRAGWEREHVDLFDMLVGAGVSEATEEGRELVRSVRERVDLQLAALDPNAADENDESDSPSDATKDRVVSLTPVLRSWDRAALNAVADATANGDSGDFALWYRLFGRLSHVSDAPLRQAAGEGIAAAALSRQPHAHRGELFTLVGTARGGKSVKAQSNPLGIQRYYVIWVQPDDDRDALIAVYSLSKPEGFPDLPEQSDLVRFAYRVKVPAYFLKKIAYEAQNSISVSPLVLARSFRFEPPQPVAAAEPPSVAALSIGMGLAAVAGTGLVSYIYLKTRRGAGDLEPMPDRIDETALRKRFVEPS
jgi:hypothetical protein